MDTRELLELSNDLSLESSLIESSSLESSSSDDDDMDHDLIERLRFI